MSDALAFDCGLSDRWRGAVDAHKAHAASEWPREAVGLISGSGDYKPCMNIAADPVSHFEVSDAQMWEVNGDRPAALLHSHTGATHPVTGATIHPRDCPSAADMVCQRDMAIPWGITCCVEGGASDPFWFGDQVPRAPLYGRTFRHGVHDCYAFIRDWYAQEAGILLPDFARDLDWWEPDDEGKVHFDLYADGFEGAGFVKVDRPYNPLPGDVFLCRVKSQVMNHGGVYVGDGLIGHHLLWELSGRRPAALWRPKLDFLVRHRDLPDDWRLE